MKLTPTKRNIHYHAIHEAAHAIICYKALGIVPDLITVSDVGGRSSFRSAISISADPHLMVTVSGAIGTRLMGYNNPSISELALNSERDSDEDWEWLKCDYEQAMDYYEQEESHYDAIKKVETEVKKILKLKWKKLIALAEVLTAKRELNKKQILKILRTP